MDFGIAERTLRRWIARPELRQALRAYWHGKQWRLDIPTTALEFARYKRDVLRAVRPFRRRRCRRDAGVSPAAKEIARSLGYGNRRRERDLRILRAAIQLKIANAKPTTVFKAKSKLAERTQTDRSADHIFEARIIAAKYDCDVFDVPNYLGLEEPTREKKNLLRRMRQTWPTREQYDKAGVQFEALWRTRTLKAASWELANFNKPITGATLSSLLFLNHDREWAWKANEKQKEFLRRYPGESAMLDPYGKRGISLRLFRQRYKRKDIAEARKVAEGVVHSESQKKSGKDAAGYDSAVNIRRSRSEEGKRDEDKDALQLEGKYRRKTSDKSVVRAIKDCEKAIREARSEDERKEIREYERQLRSEEKILA
jgi:hypothetical protein